MKKMKFFVSFALSFAMLLGIGITAGCGNKDANHEHTYDKTKWECVDENYHWHPATCEHKDEIDGSDKTAHNYNSSYKCRDCGYQHEHAFSNEWTADGKLGHYHATTCGHDARTELEEHDIGEDYKCKICGYELESDGIVIEKTTREYSLNVAKNKVKIDLSDVKVYKHMENGDKGKLLDPSEYDLFVRQGKSDVTPIDKKVTAGDYQVWAVLKADPTNEYFVSVHVLDALSGLELITTGEEAKDSVFTQKRHRRDLVSDTWKFLATYESGNTKVVTVEDGVAIKDFNTNTEGNGIAKAVYTEVDYKGNKYSEETGVGYTITHTDFVASYEDVTDDIFKSVTINTNTDTVIKEWDGGKITVTATPDKSMAEDAAGSYSDPKGNDVNNRAFEKSLNVGGVGSKDARSVKIELNDIAENEIVTIIIYVRSRASESRKVSLYDKTFEDKDSTPDALVYGPVDAPEKSKPIVKYEIDLTAKQIRDSEIYYLSAEGAYILYGLEIVYSET